MTRIRKILSGIIAIVCCTVPAIANADMQGVDIANWQCGINTYSLDADFVVVGTTWGVGGVNNVCLTNGINNDANRMLSDAMASGKSTGVYHYARTTDAIAEANFFVDNVRGYVGKSILVLDFESLDNAAWGDWNWVDRFVRAVHTRTRVWPIVYIQASALGNLSDYVTSHCGIWVAQYANNVPTGYQTRPWNYGLYGEAMRQYTSHGLVAGYSGYLDLDYFRGEKWQWDAYARGDLSSDTASDIGDIMDNDGSACTDYCVVVQSGDTLSGIAARTGLQPYTAWTGYSSGNASLIYPGETVCYGGGAVSNGNVYTVKSGDSLWSVFGTDWVRVAALNNLANPNIIYAGQQLRY